MGDEGNDMAKDDAELSKILSRYIEFVRGGKLIGRDGRIRVEYFVNLLMAVHDDGNLRNLGKILAEKIRNGVELDQMRSVAGPKRGNCLLIREVGRQLKKNTLFVRNSMLFGGWTEGVAERGEQVILVDDVASDGEVLLDAVENLRKSGIYPAAVFVLVDRPEGDCAAMLHEERITYSYVMQVTDSNLASMHAARRNS